MNPIILMFICVGVFCTLANLENRFNKKNRKQKYNRKI